MKKLVRIILSELLLLLIFTSSICTAETNKMQYSSKLKNIHVLAVFTKFLGEAPGDSTAPVWAKDLFSDKPGSISHYFNEISFGQIKITGEYLPHKYELPFESSIYATALNNYALDLITLIERDVNYANFDNDGPDGIAGSDDDDKIVDCIVLIPTSRPFNFISGWATGCSNLSMYDTFISKDKNSKGDYIRIQNSSGLITLGQDYNQLVGLFCHEYIHKFGMYDLYDIYYDYDFDDSSGVGYWDIMGRGNLGWNDRGGPNAPSAFTRYYLGCVGLNNSNLVNLFGYSKDIYITDAGLPDGKIYRIPITEKEYFLIEYRRNDGIYYDRNIPKNGLLIWHIDELASTNSDENRKFCDLECADGKFSDSGFPKGKIPDPVNGGDNLDFWSHDSEYTISHAGNHGDATDVFDGVDYTCFGPDTNPNSNSQNTGKPTGIKIFNIRPKGSGMIFDVIAPPFSGWISNEMPSIGTGFQRFVEFSDSLSGIYKPPYKNEIIRNYPNPFNSMTSIKYTLKKNDKVVLEIFNITGQKILKKDLGYQYAGTHNLTISATDFSSGVYLYRINSSEKIMNGKFEIIR